MKRLNGLFRVLVVFAAALGFFRVLANEEENSQVKAFRQGKTVELPPYLVIGQASKRLSGGHRWAYGKLPGLEVLSCCPDATTREFVKEFLRRQIELKELLPTNLQLEQTTPLTLILVPPVVGATMSGELASDMRAAAQSSGTSHHLVDIESFMFASFRMIPQLTLSDFGSKDSTGMFYVLADYVPPPPPHMGSGMSFSFSGSTSGDEVNDYSDISLTPERVSFLLENRRPPLPLWFKEAIMELYNKTRWSDQYEIKVPSLVWVTDFYTDKIKQGPKAVGSERSFPKIVPMGGMFNGPFGGAQYGSRNEFELWRSQVLLFVRWALDDSSHQRRNALWTFVDRSSRGPVTETTFKECFGMDFATVEKELNGYLFTAVKTPLVLVKVSRVKVPDLVTHYATKAEIDRIKGDWEVKEISYVKVNHPEFVSQYVIMAGASLQVAREGGNHDPLFLAVSGLYYSDIGKDTEAYPLLEQAATAHVPRPSVYVELARICLARALEKPTADGKLGPEQVTTIIGLLKESRRYAPAQARTYSLAIEVWNHAAVLPSSDDLTFLDGGVVFFPENHTLATSIAKIRAVIKPKSTVVVASGD